MDALTLLAQTEPLSGSAGYIGAGLLGAVLAWLLFVHLPAKDKQLKELLAIKDDQLDRRDKMIEKLVTEFRSEMKEAREHYERQLESVVGSFNRSMERFVCKGAS